MGGRCWCSRPNPTSVAHHSRYNGRVKQGVYCSRSDPIHPELEPFRDQIMMWHVNRRELQALTVSYLWQKFEDFIQSLFSDSEIQQCGFYLFKRLIDSGGIRVVLWSLYQDFEMAAAQARHTDNHEHPRIVCGPRPCQCQ